MFSLSLSLSRQLICPGLAAGLAACVGALAFAAEPPGKPPEGFPAYVPTPRPARVTIDGLAPYQQAAKPITDAQGRVRVVIDFIESAADRYLEAARADIARFDPTRDRHNPQTLRLLDAKGAQHGIAAEYRRNDRGELERSNITTWVGASITAYLSTGQINALRRDEDVRLLTDDRVGQFSQSAYTPPPWSPSWNGSSWTELNDWGWNAVVGKSVLPGSNRAVWIVDSGVAYHTDLPSLSSRYNVNYSQSAALVGCYAHSTHVAGIVGAASNNGQGRRGIYAGVNMRSVNAGPPVTDSSNPGGPYVCALGGGLAANELTAALDYIYWQSLVALPSAPRPNVVNVSANGMEEGFSASGIAQTNQLKITALVMPTYPFAGTGNWYWYYPGNVFVQSAGNQAGDSCSNSLLAGASAAYKPSVGASTNATDGVLVVGALNSDGQRASTFKLSYPGVTGYPNGFAPENGSNFGNCIDLWAPGDFIYSAWGMDIYGTRAAMNYGGGQPAACASGTCTSPPQSGWMHLSGTSMAAPHVAAAAAYYIDKLGLTTPSQVEQTLRANAAPLPSGLPMVRLQ